MNLIIKYQAITNLILAVLFFASVMAHGEIPYYYKKTKKLLTVVLVIVMVVATLHIAICFIHFLMPLIIQGIK